MKNRTVVMRSVPVGMPKPADFDITEEELPDLQEGQMLLQNLWLTLDPYMRSGFMMSDENLGKTIVGGTLSRVVKSRAVGWQSGDLVLGYYGWQEYAVALPTDIQWNNPDMPIEKWDAELAPPSTSLGILGMTGFTAYQGLLKTARAAAGETVVVSAASGAVGQVVGQLAKIKGARVVGIAGGVAKCAYCVDELGFDACVDYKAGNLPADLAAVVPDGIDVYFENVGGDVLEAVIPLLNEGARVPICGYIAHYNLQDEERRPTPLQRLKAEGLAVLGKDGNRDGFSFFAFSELAARQPDAEQARQEMAAWIKSGELKYRESIKEGLESCVPAFIGMLNGQNFGKTMVRLAS